MNEKIIKSITRTLYVDGCLVARQTQKPGQWSELADMENIAAALQLQEKAKDRTDVRHDAADQSRPLRNRRPKALQFKLKLLQALSKMLLLRHEPAVQSHVVCLYVQHHIETPTDEPLDTAQPQFLEMSHDSVKHIDG